MPNYDNMFSPFEEWHGPREEKLFEGVPIKPALTSIVPRNRGHLGYGNIKSDIFKV